MFGQQQSSPYAYASNPASSFLYNSMQNNMGSAYGGAYGGQSGGLLQQQFGQVMNSMSGGIQQNAQMGIVPGSNTSQMTPQQVAAQMNTGGVMSVLPMLGGSMAPKLMYPVAGVWSLVSGLKAMNSMNNEAKAQINNQFDSSQLQYERSLQEMHEVSSRWSQLGPLNNGY